MRHPTTVIAAILAVAATIAFVEGTDDWNRPVRTPTADAAYYYAFLPSLVLDGDLDFTNQYRVAGNWYRLGRAPTGRPSNVFGIGPAIFGLPAFVLGHGLARLTGDRDDGYSNWETGLVLWTSIAASLGAILLAYQLARRRLAAAPAYAGAIAAALAGPVVYYAVRQPFYAHPFATLFATLLVERWDASYGRGPRSLRTWIVLGAAAGAAMLARPQLVLWAAVLPAACVDDVRRRGTTALRVLALRWAAAAVVALLVFAPQLVAWKAIYGAWSTVPQGAGFMRWDAVAWSETLFSSRNGLFPWSPLYAVALFGVVALARKEVRLPLALLLGLFGQALVNGAAWDWWAGGSFGGRRFDSCYVVFAVGGAVLIDAALRVRHWLAAIAAKLALIAAALIVAANIELAFTTSVVSARIGGGQAAAWIWTKKIGGLRGALTAWLSAATNLPARAAFACRYGVDLTAYDRLVGYHVLGETYPGLNSYPDRRRDTVTLDADPPRVRGLQRTTGGAGRVVGDVKVLIGLNRRGDVILHVPFKHAGQIALIWNGDRVEHPELTAPDRIAVRVPARRGTNELAIEAPLGTELGPIEIDAE